jgi:hypothetical protein
MMASVKRYSPPKVTRMDDFPMALTLSMGNHMKW